MGRTRVKPNIHDVSFLRELTVWGVFVSVAIWQEVLSITVKPDVRTVLCKQVSDMVNGFFILLEKQLDVGDVVVIGTVKGTVSGIGLRTTRVTSADGTLNYIPNRNITTVSNLSRSTWHASVDIPIGPNAPLAEIKNVIEDVNQKLLAQGKFGKHPAPKIVGPVTIPATASTKASLVYRVALTTTYDAEYQLTSDCLAAYLTALNDAHVSLS